MASWSAGGYTNREVAGSILLAAQPFFNDKHYFFNVQQPKNAIQSRPDHSFTGG